MTTSYFNKVNLDLLKSQLKDVLLLDLDEFGLEHNKSGEYTSNFLGINLQSAFQPIYDVKKGDLLGHEALLRPNLGNIKEASPEFAFSYAEASGKLVKLDRVSRTLHVLNYNQLFQENGLLFLNVHPNHLISVNQHGKVFERILHAHSIPTDRVVIEIRDFNFIEQNESLLSYERQLFDAIENYHDRGYKIGIDNFGNQYSLVSRLWKIRPDFVKFDPNVIQQSETNPRLLKSIYGFINIIRDLEASPIINGIESQTQLDIATAAGADLVQGYLLGRPVPVKKLQSSDLITRHLQNGLKVGT